MPYSNGNQFYEKFMENSKECKKNIHDFVTFYLQTHKIEETSKPKKEASSWQESIY